MKKALQSLLSGSASMGSLPFEIVYALFRFYCGISIALGAGLAKVFHKIDEKGGGDWSNLEFGVPDWFVKQVGELGFTWISPGFWAVVATYGEFVGGLFIAVGLFTRISALQMAFQFFVVSFIWYNEPAPFAMYYQQLIFWSFALIAAIGSGQYSLDRLMQKRRPASGFSKAALVAGAFLLVVAPGFSQNTKVAVLEQKSGTPARVSFTLTNASLKRMELDIRCYDSANQKRIGYGCRLGALASRSDNKPVGTRIYVKKGSEWQLKYVLSASDAGRKIDLSREYKISREQELQAAADAQNELAAGLKNGAENPDMENIARSLGLEMITFNVSGKHFFGRQVHVRAQLPYDAGRSNNGFSRRLSFFQTWKVQYPAGTKIYLCSGAYWNGPVPETLLFTVDAAKANNLFRL